MNTKKMMKMPLLSGITFALIWLAVGALILSFALQFSSVKESYLGTLSYVVHGIAALIGGLSAGKRAQAKGWYYGCSLGILYGIIIIIVSFLASNISPSLQSLFMLATAIIAGTLGGMVGVNLKR